MNRRDAISRAAILLGAAISAPTVAAILSGCKAEPNAGVAAGVLSLELEKLVEALCDHILPETSTPGATEAGVPGFIYSVLKDCTPAADRDAFAGGLNQLDADARGFLKLAAGDQVAFLKQLDAAARAAGAAATPSQAAWRKLKELTVVGYFTSEAGASEVLEYVPIPGRYEGCIPMPEGQRTWAV